MNHKSMPKKPQQLQKKVVSKDGGLEGHEIETKPAAKIKKPGNVKKIILITLLSVFILLNAIFFTAGNYFYNIIINWPITNNYAIGYEGEVAEGSFNVDRFNSLEKESISVDSRYGYKINRRLQPNSCSLLFPKSNSDILFCRPPLHTMLQAAHLH